MLKGDTSENLIGLLERRLDAVIYRAKFATTIFSARQLINHGHVKVNGKKVNISSYTVKEEDGILGRAQKCGSITINVNVTDPQQKKEIIEHEKVHLQQMKDLRYLKTKSCQKLQYMSYRLDENMVFRDS